MESIPDIWTKHFWCLRWCILYRGWCIWIWNSVFWIMYFFWNDVFGIFQGELCPFRVSSENIQKFTPAPFVTNMRYDPLIQMHTGCQTLVQQRIGAMIVLSLWRAWGGLIGKILLIAEISTGKKPWCICSTRICSFEWYYMQSHTGCISWTFLLICLLKTVRHINLQYWLLWA